MFTKTNKGNDTQSSPKSNNTPPAQTAIRSASTKPTARSAPSIISADMYIKGSVTSDGEMQIDGKIEGDVSAVSLTIGQTGSIQGEVKAQTVVVRGRIVGAVRARKVELESGAHVEGDIVHASLAIQSNAVFQGQVKHSSDPLKDTAADTAKPSTSADAAPAATTSGGFGVPN